MAEARINSPRRNRRGYIFGFAPIRVPSRLKFPSFVRGPYSRMFSLLTSGCISGRSTDQSPAP